MAKKRTPTPALTSGRFFFKVESLHNRRRCVTVEETSQELAPFLAPPVTAIFNSSIRECVIVHIALFVLLPKEHPRNSIETELMLLSLTPISSKVLELYIYVAWGWIDDMALLAIDRNQFGASKGTDTRDVLTEIFSTTGTLCVSDQPG